MNDTGNESGFAGQSHQDAWKQRRGARGAWLAATFIVAALVVTVAIIQGAYHRSSRNVPELPDSRKVASTNAPSPGELSMSFREVAKAVKPAVVFVSIVENVSSDSGQSDFFGVPGQGIPRRREGAGSDFIVTEDGYILTNNHVVGNATKINVTLSDGRKVKAVVVGADPETDIAVIKIDAGSLPIAVLGDSDDVQQGDWVLAMGSPFGLQQTLTAGIVSATGRELRESTYNHYIQTDASINPGNSGGPLVNMQGEVVGINTMILTGGMSQGNIGIGFAIASNTARDVFRVLVRAGKVNRGYLGVFVSNLDAATAHALKLQPNAGVFVGDVPDSDSPAWKAGIRPKDVITAFNGKPVKAARELTDTVAATPAGQTARVDFIRDGQPQTVSVRLAERPNNANARAIPSDRGDAEGGAIQQGGLGIQGRTITPETIEEMGLKLKVPTGVFVASVQPGSPAADAGLLHGDVIHGLDGAEVKSVEQLAQAVKALEPGDYLLEVERNRRPLFLTVTLE